MIEQVICALAYEVNNWLECVPMVELVVNSAVVEATGMSPAYFMFGPHLQMSFNCLDGHAFCVGSAGPSQALGEYKVACYEEVTLGVVVSEEVR